jgi:hypothetical protein
MAILVSQATQDGNALSLTSSDNSNTFYGSSYADQITYIGTNNFVVADISNLDQIVLSNLSSNLDYTIQTAGNNVVINLTGGKKVTFQAIANGESFTVNFGSAVKQLTVTRSSDVFTAAGRTLTSTPQSIPLSLKASESGGTLTIDGTPLGALVIDLTANTLTDSGTAVTLSSGTLASANNVTFASNTITSATITGDSGANKLTLADGGNTATLALTAVESVVGGTGADVITLGAAVSALSFDGSTGADSLTLVGAGNTATLIAVESLVGGTGADLITLTTALSSSTFTMDGSTGADSLTLAVAGNSGTLALTAVESLVGGTGIDVITLTSTTGATVTLGTGADQLTLSANTQTDTIVIAAGDSTLTFGGSGDTGTVTGYDKITTFELAGGDKLNVTGTGAVAGNGTYTTDSTLTIGGAVVSSVKITSGAVVFSAADDGSSGITIDSAAKLAAALQALQANDIGATSATTYFVATIASTASTYVYTQSGETAGGDLVQLIGVSGTSLMTTGATASGVFIL